MAVRRACRRGRNFPQFDGHALAARNCAISVTRSMIHFGTHGTIKLSAANVRARMGTSAWATPFDVKKAVESIDKEAKRKGYKPLRYKMAGRTAGKLFLAGASRASLIARVKRLEMVHVVVHYGRVNDTMAALSGSPGFRSRHAIWVGGGNEKEPGWRKRKGRLQVRYADPTWGRKGAPKAAPKWVDLDKVWEIADGAWSERGGRGWVGGSVACSPLRGTKPEEPPVPDEPPDICEERILDLEDQLAEANEQLDEAQALIETLKDRRLPRELVDELLDLSARIDAATPVIDDDTLPEDTGEGMEPCTRPSATASRSSPSPAS